MEGGLMSVEREVGEEREAGRVARRERVGERGGG